MKNRQKYNISLPKFCSQCGGKMIPGKKKINRYNNETGEVESYRYTLKCEKICGWKIIFHWFGIHDNFLVIDIPKNRKTGKPFRIIINKWIF